MRILMLVLIVALISGCGSSREKTGEAMLFDSGKLKVKVVQIYEDMPWHYYGLRHEILCRSPKTMDMAWGGMERGWNRISYSGISEPGPSPSKEIQKKTLAVAAKDANKFLMVVGDEAIVYASYGIFVMSNDGCNTFSIWNGWNLPEDMVVQTEKSSTCKEGECPWENFEGDREISFSDINIDEHSKEISFRAHSKAFMDGDLLVQSKDAGISWKISR